MTTPHAAVPISLRLGQVPAMLNAELADHPVYDGFELQRFDDPEHGSGILAFLTRRADGTVDYAVQRGLRLDRARYGIGGGIRSWREIDFDRDRLEVSDAGTVAQVRFADADGHVVEIDVDDRAAGPRRPAALLAPLGAAIRQPASLMLVWMPSFDLLRAVPGHDPVVRIGGRDVATGRLPAGRLHGRLLVKTSGRLWVLELNRDGDPPAVAGGPGEAAPTTDGDALRGVRATADGHAARVLFRPPLPDPGELADGDARHGAWRVLLDDALLTGGTWSVEVVDGRAEVELAVTRRWRPRRLPGLMRLVTTALPVFRTWPTTYAWHASVPLDGGPATTAWRRTGTAGAAAYRRATSS
ncbi:hypothetical protein [Isoptericola sediminis]|uniref:Uncharacterized protein n=1 Tax=Isoptericola sediminis TaxID=2733572 RepID=A0A849K1D9_9MICO|nr:hypothetical protein [Isoptericola sediminis]NNU26978.1 hypothetical protein [Isoptericola sediminis]